MNNEYSPLENFLNAPMIDYYRKHPEEFMEEQYGLLIDKGSIEQAEDAMLYMCKNIRDYNGIAISEQIRKRFSPETIAKQLMIVYEEIV